jgi:hypothetical protein
MWAVKIFDDATEEFNHSVLDLAEKWGAGIECALYANKGMTKSVNERLASVFAGNPKHALGLHLPHSKVSMMGLQQQRWGGREMVVAMNIGDRHDPNPILAPERGGDNLLNLAARRLAREAGWCRVVKNRDAVIHLSRSHCGEDELWRGLNPREYARMCVPAIEASWALGVRLHLEKTHESLVWLAAYYDEVAACGLASKFGFTFDIGHSRVWERESLENWMAMIGKLDKMGFGLHFHLHGNPGDADRHDTLGLAQSMGWLEPDAEWAPRGAMPILAEIQRLYENKALLVLENSAVHAWENLGWVELALK